MFYQKSSQNICHVTVAVAFTVSFKVVFLAIINETNILENCRKEQENDSGVFKVKVLKKQIISGETRRLGVNLPEVYKILTATKISQVMTFSQDFKSILSCHSLELKKLRFRLNLKEYCFSCKIVNERHILRQELHDCRTLSHFVFHHLKLPSH